jgi:molecular chaperone HtpG
MKTKQFKTESKRILDLMINSIYTHKEIFLRELISNASDAIDKLYFKSLTDPQVGMARSDFKIIIEPDKEKRTLTIIDNGIGMTQDELENNLGTIAHSGTLDFKQENELKDDIEIIGQFGVGFYSAFMVSKKITVISRAYGSDKAYCWQSTGIDGYNITEAEKDTVGTEIILEIKDNQGEENYDEFLEQHRISDIVKRYSDYIRYPINMEVTKSRLKKKEEADADADADADSANDEKNAAQKTPEYETYTEIETLNSMIPLWRRNKSELQAEDYENFYKDKFYDFEKPLRYVHINAEGTLSYNALLYIPAKTPYNYYSKEYEKGLQLYSNGVLIMDKCGDLLPDHFSFVKGLVDSQDLSLNISREMLQHDRQLKAIARSLEKKIKGELQKMQKENREQYEQFYKAFGLQLKFGIYNGFGAKKEDLQDLLMYHSIREDKLVTLAEYKEKMPEGQDAVYYACGDNVQRIKQLPQSELVLDKGYDILAMTDDVDEFAIRMMYDFEGKPYKSISSSDLGLETEADKEAAAKKSEDYKEMFGFIKDALGDKVKEVRISKRLKSHPVCLASDGALSLEMEKVLNSMPTDKKVKAERVLEINADHPVFETMKKLYENDKDKLKTYSEILYNQALLIEGMPIEDPVAFSNAICSIM